MAEHKARVEAARKRHLSYVREIGIHSDPTLLCVSEGVRWPCDVAYLLTQLDNALSFIHRLSEFVYDADPSIMDAFMFGENVAARSKETSG